MIRRAALAALAGVVLTVITGLATPASAAAPTCSGTGCDGRDVTTTNCQDSKAFAIDGYYPGDHVTVFDLWYSPTCHAMWGDGSTASPSAGFLSLYGIAPYSGTGIAKELGKVAMGAGNGDVHTPLFNSIQSVRLCWHITPGLPPSDDNSNSGDFACSGWR